MGNIRASQSQEDIPALPPCLFPTCLEPLGVQGCVAERKWPLLGQTEHQRSPEGKTLCGPLWSQGAQPSNLNKETLLNSYDGNPDPEQEVRWRVLGSNSGSSPVPQQMTQGRNHKV